MHHHTWLVKRTRPNRTGSTRISNDWIIILLNLLVFGSWLGCCATSAHLSRTVAEHHRFQYIYFHFNGRSLFIWISIETAINGHSKIELKYKRFMHLNWTARKIYLFLSIFRSSPSERNLVSGQYSYRWEFWASWRCHTQPFNISEHRASACERTVRLHGQQYEFGAAE